MGVYIKNMEMPTRCADCKMYVEDIYCCHLLHREIENPWADDGVELDCPLIEIPPHGRLIDADAIRADIDEKRPGRSYEDAWALTIMDAAPAVIEADKAEEV